MNSLCERCKEHIGLPYVFYHGTITGVKNDYNYGVTSRTTSFQAQQVPIQVFLCQRCVKKSYEGGKRIGLIATLIGVGICAVLVFVFSSSLPPFVGATALILGIIAAFGFLNYAVTLMHYVFLGEAGREKKRRNDEAGEELAIKMRAESIKAQQGAGQVVWTPKELASGKYPRHI